MTTAKIARAAGIGEGTIFRVFADKEELLQACVAEALSPDHAVRELDNGYRPPATRRDVAADPRVRAVSITAPNFLHREIGVAMAEAGKHIWIEKPVGLTAEDARAVADAVAKAGVQGAVGFNYRNAPAVEAARDLIASGGIGRVTHARVRLFSDYAAHPERADLALRAGAGRQRGAGRPGLARRRPGAFPARRHHLAERRHGRLPAPAGPPYAPPPLPGERRRDGRGGGTRTT
ncbi:Inositol 2-dehydrogenase/D-chiro-inositol 3-dehydrogenase [Streptomyces griseoloalbus]